MTIAEFDHMDAAKKKSMLEQCCGSTNWVKKMIEALPAEDLVDMLEIAEEQWYACSKEDWLEAFAHHSKTGDTQELAEANKQYEDKFGYNFIHYTTDKMANEILVNLKARLQNNPDAELNIAMEEQLKITKERIEKLFTA